MCWNYESLNYGGETKPVSCYWKTVPVSSGDFSFWIYFFCPKKCEGKACKKNCRGFFSVVFICPHVASSAVLFLEYLLSENDKVFDLPQNQIAGNFLITVERKEGSMHACVWMVLEYIDTHIIENLITSKNHVEILWKDASENTLLCNCCSDRVLQSSCSFWVFT